MRGVLPLQEAFLSQRGWDSCPAPLPPKVVTLAHGGGGLAMARLLDEVIFRDIRSPELSQRHDSAALDFGGLLQKAGARVAFTTDTYVVSPLFFPGGDIGKLAVYGTVNDLAMAGGEPFALSLALLLEEGFPLSELSRVTASIQAACDHADVRIVTGDTKVVPRGKGDGLYVTTSGVGLIRPHVRVAPDRIGERDCVLVSGDIGRHGIAVLGAREGLGFETPVESDCAPLAAPMKALLDAGIDVHAARDLTRGGLAAALCELSRAAEMTITLEEDRVPIAKEVGAACELFGLDPLHVASEGRMVLFVAPQDEARARAILMEYEQCSHAARIGTVERGAEPRVEMRTLLGGRRLIDLPSGELLPRIC